MIRRLPPARERLIRRGSMWLAVGAYSFVVVFLVLAVDFVHPTSDYAAYWASARLFLAGENPYDPESIFMLQKSIGWSESIPRVIWYPPWALILLAPLGLPEYSPSRILWVLISIFLVLTCSAQLWRFYAGSQWLSASTMAYVLAIIFVPTFMLLAAGQITAVVLLGVVGFLYLERNRNWWLAGMTLGLVSIKPQLVYLFLMALLLWAGASKRWSVVWGMVFVLVGLTGMAWFVNPQVLQQYLHVIRTYPPNYWITPTAGSIMRLVLGWDNYWLQLVPSLFGLVWLLMFWRHNAKNWSWPEHLPMLLLAGLVSAPFAWVFDQVLLLVAIMQASLWIIGSRLFELRRRALAAFAATNLMLLVSIPATTPMIQGGSGKFIALKDPNRAWGYVFVLAFMALYVIIRRRYWWIMQPIDQHRADDGEDDSESRTANAP